MPTEMGSHMADSKFRAVRTKRALWRAMHDGVERIEVRGPLAAKVAAGIAQTPAASGLAGRAVGVGAVPLGASPIVVASVVIGFVGLTYLLVRLASDYDEVHFEASYKGAKASAHFRRKRKQSK